MAIITTPGAGVSPYEPTTAAPTILRAGADGTTVSTSTAAAAATVSELAAANANTLVVVSGQAALNSLITSNQPGVFEGANVTINLEEQNFNTTNQVTSTINSPSGSTGEIQYNSGANSFASDPYFTYTNSNVVTPGIRTNSYLYANGAPFLAGGNAAIGNFVFNGDTMTISDSNQTMNITGNGTGNINVTANGNTWIFGNNRILTLPGGPRIVPVGANLELQAASGGYAAITTSDGNSTVDVNGSGAQIVTSGINTWTFDNVGNLILPGNTFAVKYANGDTVAISTGGFPLANGTSNIDIATANGNVTITANGSPTWTFAADGNLTFPSTAQITVDGTGAAVFQHEGGITIAETNGNSLVYNTVIELFDNAVHLGTDQQGNAYSWDFSQDGSMTVPGNISGANVVSANVYTAPSNVSITSSGNTWTFNTDGNLTLPTAGNIVGAVNIIGNGTGNVNVEANGRVWTFAADGNLVLPLAGNIVNYGNTWNFGYDGNLTLPANIIAINYANGNRVTGNITFRDEIVIGTGTSNLISGLYLAPSSSSADANMYLRVRGNINDEPTHIHFDTGNNAYYNQFIGDDNKYIQLANTGNIVINSNDVAGNAAQWTFGINGNTIFPNGATFTGYDFYAAANSYIELAGSNDNTYMGVDNTSAFIQTDWNNTQYQWTFGSDGNLTFPTGNLVIIPDYASESNAAVISSTDHILGLLSTGVNGGVQSVWVEDVANIGTSNIAAVRVSPISQTGNVQIQTGNNSSINNWNFGADGNLTLPGNLLVPANSIITGAAGSPAPSINGFDTINAITFSASGNITGNNLAATNLVINSITSDDSTFVTIEDGVNITTGSISSQENLSLTASAQTWTFRNDGVGIVLPGGAAIRDTSGGSLAIGVGAGSLALGNTAVAIGYQAAFLAQGNNSVAIGRSAGETQGEQAVAIGLNAGRSQGNYAVAIGKFSANSSQGEYSVAIGPNAGFENQLSNAVSIGSSAAANSQGINSVAVGVSAAYNTQGNNAVAIGNSAAYLLQGLNSVAIGDSAGIFYLGNNSIAIGANAGNNLQGDNSIVFNATGSNLRNTTANTFTVAPVRNDVANIAEIVFYNATSKEITYGNVVSVAGNITGNYFIGNGAALTDVGVASVPGQNILPTIQTITISATSNGGTGGGTGWANVTVANTIPVTEYGVIITAGTVSQTYATGALGSIPGTVQLTITTGLNTTPFTVYAYVTSNAGTYYSNSATGTSGICLLAGTQIALSDGTHKAIEDITYTDKLLSWDFDRGCYAETTAMWIKRSETGSQYNLLTFSDGTTLRTFDQHRIFNKQAGAFTYPMTAATPVGTVTVNEHGQEITLTNKQVIRDTIEYYNVITDYHMNLFSDSVLTSCRFNNIYPITDMKFAKDGRTLRTRAEFENVPDRFFHGLRLAEQTTDIETVEWYVNRLLSTEVSTHAELAV